CLAVRTAGPKQRLPAEPDALMQETIYVWVRRVPCRAQSDAPDSSNCSASMRLRRSSSNSPSNIQYLEPLDPPSGWLSCRTFQRWSCSREYEYSTRLSPLCHSA